MKFHHHVLFTASALLSLTALSGCYGGDSASLEGGDTGALETPDAEIAHTDQPAPFAVFESEAYGKVSFIELEPGELLVVTLTPDEAADGDVVQVEDPFELYEQLSGEPLPERFAALRDVDRTSSTEGDEEMSDSGEVELPSLAADEPGVQATLTKETISEETFMSRNCGFDRGWCWTSRTNTSYFQKRDTYIRGWVHCYRGKVTHKIHRKNTWGNWVAKYETDVPAGHTSTEALFTVVPYTMESRVYNASGDGYHHSGRHNPNSSN